MPDMRWWSIIWSLLFSSIVTGTANGNRDPIRMCVSTEIALHNHGSAFHDISPSDQFRMPQRLRSATYSAGMCTHVLKDLPMGGGFGISMAIYGATDAFGEMLTGLAALRGPAPWPEIEPDFAKVRITDPELAEMRKIDPNLKTLMRLSDFHPKGKDRYRRLYVNSAFNWTEASDYDGFAFAMQLGRKDKVENVQEFLKMLAAKNSERKRPFTIVLLWSDDPITSLMATQLDLTAFDFIVANLYNRQIFDRWMRNADAVGADGIKLVDQELLAYDTSTADAMRLLKAVGKDRLVVALTTQCLLATAGRVYSYEADLVKFERERDRLDSFCSPDNWELMDARRKICRIREQRLDEKDAQSMGDHGRKIMDKDGRWQFNSLLNISLTNDFIPMFDKQTLYAPMLCQRNNTFAKLVPSKYDEIIAVNGRAFAACETPTTVERKMRWLRDGGYRGVMLFSSTYSDRTGACWGEKFPFEAIASRVLPANGKVAHAM